ncbi:hypothetical protein QO034_15910 [Sedimentitalea sp. JM2-8]|uniref:Uncharacterized protein n=1 Tax=Sedimentitalea xiamensis TaxID=3050037 RepID=A0ABT7FHQ6_9RHOB|nr:hypothetical protein [Sedimentitalea xiamensis]MDK3074580.1 hypothetical protein [Sedimentitalea xiamensis]
MADGVTWLDQTVLIPSVMPPALSLGAKVATGAALYALSHLLLWGLAGRPRGFEHFLLSWLFPALRRA